VKVKHLAMCQPYLNVFTITIDPSLSQALLDYYSIHHCHINYIEPFTVRSKLVFIVTCDNDAVCLDNLQASVASEV